MGKSSKATPAKSKPAAKPAKTASPKFGSPAWNAKYHITQKGK